MTQFRIQVKFFLETSDGLDLSRFSGIFHRWIQQKSLDGMLIDVADYRHVFEGPGVVLIGHESDYSIETRDGRTGLLYNRKREFESDLPAQLRTAFRLSLAAINLLEQEKSFVPALRFDRQKVEIRFADRLQYPNTPETLATLQSELSPVLNELLGGVAEISPASPDSRSLLTLKVQIETVRV